MGKIFGHFTEEDISDLQIAAESLKASPTWYCFCCLVTKSCSTLATLWTVACQGPLSMKFSRQEYWSGLPFPTSGDLPDPRIKPTSLASPALAGTFFITHHLGSHAKLGWHKKSFCNWELKHVTTGWDAGTRVCPCWIIVGNPDSFPKWLQQNIFLLGSS